MIGQKLGSYRIEGELGTGAMGVVYRGFNEVKNKPAAVKVISVEQMGKGKAHERFIREAEILEQFRHPNIVKYMGRGRAGGQYYYAMEFITGPTLEKVLRERGTLPWKEVAALGVQLCDALQYSHEKGVVHRDLKPSNLMITEHGQLKLTDFGIAKDLDATALTGTGRTLGTATYMAPEQIRGTPDISHKTDLYSLGAVFYHLLTGVPPFNGPTALVMMHAHINEPVKRPSDKVEEIPKALDDLVIALMAKSPQERPWDAQAVGEILRDLVQKATRKETIKMVWPEPGSPESMPTRADMFDVTLLKKSKALKKKDPAQTRREILEVAGLVLALALIGGVIGYLLWPPSAGYIYRKAEVLMASPDPMEWLRARDEYLDRLDARFPKHPYKEQTEAWRDRIDLRDVERRAEVLEKTNLSGFSKPKTEAEDQYQTIYTEVVAAQKRKDDREAGRFWRLLEKQMDTGGRLNRGWMLLARAKAEASEKIVDRRRETVATLMNQATVASQLIDHDLARKRASEILKDVIQRFGDYPEVTDYVSQAKAVLGTFEVNSPSGDSSTTPPPPTPPIATPPKILTSPIN
jgi:serine/threonine-protein kinase